MPLSGSRLLFEIAPPLRVEGRPAVCARLGELLTAPTQPRWTPGYGPAARLAAAMYQFGMWVLIDTGTKPVGASGRQWSPALRNGWTVIPATSLDWGARKVGLPNVRPTTHVLTFIAELPAQLASNIIRWAPPVVIEAPRGRFRVVSCHLSAVIARLRYPGSAVKVRQLASSPTSVRTLQDVYAEAMRPLRFLYWHYRRLVAELSSGPDEAMLLTQYARAQYFRIRRGKTG